MDDYIVKNTGGGSQPIVPTKIPIPEKGYLRIKRAKGDGRGSLYTGKSEAYYFEKGKFYRDEGFNPAYNKKFPRRKPVLGVWDEYSVRQING